MASSSDESPLELTEGSQKFLDLFFAPSHTPLACLPVADAREAALRAVRQYGGPYLPVAHVEDVELATKDGCGCFHIRVYWSVLESEASGELPVLLYAHGGGWMRGSVDTTDQVRPSVCVFITLISKEGRLGRRRM
jgi:acetyl esterase